jgi:hypothetical protein
MSIRHQRERERWGLDWVEAPNPPDSSERAAAWRRLHGRRSFERQIIGVVIVNALVVAIWALSSRGYFWPAWVMAISAVLVILRSWDFARRPISEADIDAEVERERSGRAASTSLSRPVRQDAATPRSTPQEESEVGRNPEQTTKEA